MPHLARAHWHRYRAQAGFDGLIERESWASIVGEEPDPAVTAVIATKQYQKLVTARNALRRREGIWTLTDLVNAYTALSEAVDDERMQAALSFDQCALLLELDEHQGTNDYAENVVTGLAWALNRTPWDDPQRARRLVDCARARANAGRRPGQVLANYRAAAQLALRERPVWHDVLAEVAQYECGLGAPIYLAGALVMCRDLTEALERDFGTTAKLSGLAELEHEVSGRIGPDVAQFLLTCHRNPDVLQAQRDKVEALLRQSIGPGVLVERRDQTWLLAIGLPLDHEGRLDELLDLYRQHTALWEFGGDTEAIELAFDTAYEATFITSPDHACRAEVLEAFSHAAATLSVLTESRMTPHSRSPQHAPCWRCRPPTKVSVQAGSPPWPSRWSSSSNAAPTRQPAERPSLSRSRPSR